MLSDGGFASTKPSLSLVYLACSEDEWGRFDEISSSVYDYRSLRLCTCLLVGTQIFQRCPPGPPSVNYVWLNFVVSASESWILTSLCLHNGTTSNFLPPMWCLCTPIMQSSSVWLLHSRLSSSKACFVTHLFPGSSTSLVACYKENRERALTL